MGGLASGLAHTEELGPVRIGPAAEHGTSAELTPRHRELGGVGAPAGAGKVKWRKKGGRGLRVRCYIVRREHLIHVRVAASPPAI